MHDLEIVEVTEAGAIAASQWVGSGDKEEADRAATDAMRKVLNRMDFRGIIVLGEGIKDKSHGLFPGETVGRGIMPYDLCVDPIEGTRPVAIGGPEAISVLGIGETESMLAIEEFYSLKLAYGPLLNDFEWLHPITPDAGIPKIVAWATRGLVKPAEELVVCMLDRPRHRDYIDQFKSLGVRLKLVPDCDVTGAIATCMPDSGIDLLFGIGGSPEAVISACAIKCLRGGFQCMPGKMTGDCFKPTGGVLGISDLVKGDCTFAATGITDGSLLRGVQTSPDAQHVTHSMFLQSHRRKIQWIKSEYPFESVP